MRESPIPEARVVLGRHAPPWSRQHWKTAPAPSSATTYARETAGMDSAIALLCGFWPLIAIITMGVAMVWSASVFNGP